MFTTARNIIHGVAAPGMSCPILGALEAFNWMYRAALVVMLYKFVSASFPTSAQAGLLRFGPVIRLALRNTLPYPSPRR